MSVYQILFVCVVCFLKTGTGCSYAIKDLDGIRQLNDSITLSSDAEVGDNVYSMKANINFRRRKRTAEIDDIELLTNSTHFEFLYVSNSHHDLVVKSCLQAGFLEALEFSMHHRIHVGTCGTSFLGITVAPTVPVFVGNKNAVVEVQDPCAAVTTPIDVIEVSLNKTGNCISWNCTANCSNDNKTFWLDAAEMVIQTYIDNINYSLTYELEVTCLESGSLAAVNESDYKHLYQVEFTKALVTCTSTTFSTISTSFSPQTTSKDCPASASQHDNFFDNSINSAAVAFATGITVGGVSGAGIYALASRQCSAIPLGASRKRNGEVSDDTVTGAAEK